MGHFQVSLMAPNCFSLSKRNMHFSELNIHFLLRNDYLCFLINQYI